MAVLHINNCTMCFGGLTAVNDLNFSVNEQELVGMIGPNGAGKTTVFNIVTGVYKPTKGNIFLGDNEITGLKPFEVCQQGIARTFQNIRLFKSLSVYQTVQVSLVKSLEHGFSHALTRFSGYRSEEKKVDATIMEILEIFDLTAVKDEQAASLPYGDQRRVEIVRALATKPKLLLLDEPAAGMNPTEKNDLMHLIRKIRDRYKIAILLIEHDMKVVMGICERVAVLDYGIKIAEGVPEAICRDTKVIEAYLGEQV